MMKPMKPLAPMQPMQPMKGTERWWPESLGDSPNSAGGQNEMRYAYFGARHRLAVDRGDGRVRIYDTGEQEVSGVHQRQAGGEKKLVFSGSKGEVELDRLKQVEA